MKPKVNKINKSFFFPFLPSSLGLGYHFWKLQAQSVKLEYRHWQQIKSQSTKG